MESKPLIIFGASGGALKVVKMLKNFGVHIHALTDNNEKKWGTVCEGVSIIPPIKLLEIDCDIMIASTYQEEIEEQLRQYGVLDKLVLKEQYIQKYIDQHINEFGNLKFDNKIETVENPPIIFGLEEGMWLGGVENLTFMWARELKRRGRKVWIFSNVTEDPAPADLAENVRYFDLAYERYWAALHEVVSAIWEIGPCIVIDNWDNQILAAVSIVKRISNHHVRCISILHNDKLLFYRRTAYMEAYIDAIAGVSLEINRHMREDFGISDQKLIYKESPVEFDIDLVKSYTMDERMPLQIGYAARITKTQKRADLLVPLIQNFVDAKIPFHFHIAGIGDYFDKLQCMIREKGLENHITLYGWVDRGEMIKFWSNKDVFVNVSDYEGLPLSMLEAMASGVVPVVTHVSGTDQFISSSENGYICDCGDIDAFVEHIKDLNSHRQRLQSMGEQAMKIVREKCNKKDYVDYLLGRIEAII